MARADRGERSKPLDTWADGPQTEPNYKLGWRTLWGLVFQRVRTLEISSTGGPDGKSEAEVGCPVLGVGGRGFFVSVFNTVLCFKLLGRNLPTD